MDDPTPDLHPSQDPDHPHWRHVRSLLDRADDPAGDELDGYDLSRLAAALPHLPGALQWRAAVVLHRAWLRARLRRRETTPPAARLALERFRAGAARKDPLLMGWVLSTLASFYLTGATAAVIQVLAHSLVASLALPPQPGPSESDEDDDEEPPSPP